MENQDLDQHHPARQQLHLERLPIERLIKTFVSLVTSLVILYLILRDLLSKSDQPASPFINQDTLKTLLGLAQPTLGQIKIEPCSAGKNGTCGDG